MLHSNEFKSRLSAGCNLVFVHIPKTAGSTFVDSMRLSFPRHTAFAYDSKKQSSLLDEDKISLEKPYCIGGHMPLYKFGRLDFSSTVFLSFVRDPVDRLFSYYRFSRTTETRNVVSDTARSMNFSGFLNFLENHRPRILRNQQCRFLSNTEAMWKDIALDFDMVREGLKKVPILIAPTESCSALLSSCAEIMFPCENLKSRLQKVSSKDPNLKLTQQDRDAVLRWNAADQELFNWYRQVNSLELP